LAIERVAQLRHSGDFDPDAFARGFQGDPCHAILMLKPL